MNDAIYQGIEKDPRFRELVRKRGRFAWLLSIITLVLYVSFILLIAFDPQWLGTPIGTDTVITRGIPVGIGLILISFILTGIYVFRANGEFDRLTQELVRGVKP
ncbi:DUF485 domain-containing protein [Nissabacter sp. SGAir0207]|uniref:DUF485 domain-containing protein n=1 Tax=Nissabacter sp. SGAir0207 TaxID=2126321 RepID=UPI0010CD5D95|nr:DUF485 domain-containing protein [Nissabacter sp. SGAir0207]QCR34866.1 hypothetical protein C1N62_01580 [Nissabacter sp. SGAir0207]